jgi:hypothetical protein
MGMDEEGWIMKKKAASAHSLAFRLKELVNAREEVNDLMGHIYMEKVQ